MPLIQCRSAATPVTISAQATGVTEGKLETQSGTSTPRSSSSPKVGARPSRDGPLEHVGPQRVDVGEDELLRRHARRMMMPAGERRLAQDAEARVLALGAAVAGDARARPGRR